MSGRQLRVSVDADTYSAIERHAKTLDISVAMATRFVLAFGLTAIEQVTTPDEESRGSP